MITRSAAIASRSLLAAGVVLTALVAGCAAPAETPSARPTTTGAGPEAEVTPDQTGATRTPSPTPSDTATATPGRAPKAEQHPEPEPVAEPGITITSGGSAFGPMLFDGSRQAIYIWEVETSPEARCYGDCAAAWPPVLTDGAPVAAGGVSAALLGTTTRSDGTTQVTYNGHPLYYYAHEAPGEVRCHDVSTHGGLWWVVQPNGIRAP